MRANVSIADYDLEFDSDETARCYQNFSSLGPESCGCDDCRNWVLARDTFLTPEIRRFLSQFGIAGNGEIEVTEMGRGEIQPHLYTGWYFIVGRIARNPMRNAFVHEFPVGAAIFYFTERMSFPVEAFDAFGVFELHFTTQAGEYLGRSNKDEEQRPEKCTG